MTPSRECLWIFCHRVFESTKYTVLIQIHFGNCVKLYPPAIPTIDAFHQAKAYESHTSTQYVCCPHYERDHADHAPAGIYYRSSQDYPRSHSHSCLDLNYTSGLFHVAIPSPRPEDLVILDHFHRCPVIRMRNLWSWITVSCLTKAIWSYLL